MTILTLKGSAIHSQAVSFQGKAKLVMRIPSGRNSCERSGGAMMFSMTVAAIKAGFSDIDHTVQAGWIFELSCNIGMTFQTTVRHCRSFPGTGMAGTALLNFRMGGYAAQRRT